jgi:hypothetical protein
MSEGPREVSSASSRSAIVSRHLVRHAEIARALLSRTQLGVGPSLRDGKNRLMLLWNPISRRYRIGLRWGPDWQGTCYIREALGTRCALGFSHWQRPSRTGELRDYSEHSSTSAGMAFSAGPQSRSTMPRGGTGDRRLRCRRRRRSAARSRHRHGGSSRSGAIRGPARRATGGRRGTSGWQNGLAR